MMGEAESAKQLGLLLNVDRVKDYAEAQGLVYEELTDAERAQQVYNLAVEQSQNAIGDAERSSESYTNKLKAFKSGLADVTAEFGQKLLPAATNITNLLLNKGIPAFEKFLNFMSKAWEGSKTVVLESAKSILQAIKFIVDGINNWVKSNEENLNVISENFSKIFGIIKDGLAAFWKFIVEVWEENSATIGRIADKYLKLIVEIWKTVTTGILVFWERWGDDIKRITGAIFDAIKINISTVLKTIENIIDVFNALMKGDFETVKKEILEIWDDWVTAFGDIFLTLYAAIEEPILKFNEALANWAIDIIDKMTQFGSDMIAGLISGITGKIDDAKEAISSVATKISDTFTNFFEIKSPSRLMKRLARFLGDGIVLGILNSENSIVKQAVDTFALIGKAFVDTANSEKAKKDAKESGENIAASFAGGVADGEGNLLDKTSSFLQGGIDKIDEMLNPKKAEKKGSDYSKAVADGVTENEKEISDYTKKYMEYADDRVNADTKYTETFTNLSDSRMEQLANEAEEIETLSDKICGSWGDISQILGATSGAVGGKTGGLIDSIMGIGNIVGDFASGNWGGAVAGIISEGKNIMDGVINFFRGDSGPSLSEIMAEAWEGMQTAVGYIISDTSSSFQTFVGNLQNFTVSMSGDTTTAVGNMLNNLKGIFDTITAKGFETTNTVGNTTSKTLDVILSNSTDFMERTIERFDLMAQEITFGTAAIIESAESEWDAILGVVDHTTNEISYLLDASYEDIGNTFGNISEAGNEAWKAILETAGETLEELKPLVQELTDQAVSEADRLGDAVITALEERYNKEEEKQIDAINDRKDLNEQQKLDEIALVNEKYDELRKAENLEQEALLMATEEGQDAIIALLETYNPKWQDVGQSFGDKLVNGLNSERETITETVSDILGIVDTALVAIDELEQAEADLKAKEDYAARILTLEGEGGATTTINTNKPIGTSTGSYAGTVGKPATSIVQNITVNSPKALDAQESAREMKLASQQLAFA